MIYFVMVYITCWGVHSMQSSVTVFFLHYVSCARLHVGCACFAFVLSCNHLHSCCVTYVTAPVRNYVTTPVRNVCYRARSQCTFVLSCNHLHSGCVTYVTAPVRYVRYYARSQCMLPCPFTVYVVMVPVRNVCY